MADRVPILHDFQQRSLIPIVQVEKVQRTPMVIATAPGTHLPKEATQGGMKNIAENLP